MTDAVWAVLTERPPAAQGADRRRQGRVEHATGEYQLDRTPSPRGQRPRSSPRRLAGAQRGAARGARRLHRPPQARQASSSSAARRSTASRRDRLGARRGARVRLAADRGDPDPAHRPGHRARHLQPAPPGPARPEDRPGALRRSSTCRARWRRWSCTTARCRRWRASASSTATRRRARRRWCSGRPSSATSPTAPR